MKTHLRLIPFIMLLTSQSIWAHTMEDNNGFLTGLLHPVLGLDHLLAMISVGALSSQISGSAIWKIPLVFVSIMLGGGLLGMSGIEMPLVEYGIASSVLVLGIAMALEKKVSIWGAIIGVGIFATFHGHAHGVEMPSLSNPWLYAFGFITGTSLIHIAGISIGHIAKKIPHGHSLLRHLGSAIAGIGFYILIGA